MADEKDVVVEQPQEMNAQTYLEELAKAKSNTVSKELYEKLQEENKMLAKSLREGIGQPQEEEVEVIPTIEEASKELSAATTNLEYAKASLRHRAAVLAATGQDVYVGRGHQINTTEESYNSARKLAEAFQHCIDVADGDDAVFTMELNRITNDVALPRRY